MTDLSEFLLARISEDEAMAQAATPGPWIAGSQGWNDANGNGFIVAPYHDLDISDEDAGHVTRWQPSRALAECAVKRRIVEIHETDDPSDGTNPAWLTCLGCDRHPPCPTLRLLAVVYADHADYDESWRP